MSLASEYKRQRGWRDWPRIFEALPPLQGQTVLDLGCGVGDLAAELAARGARVLGVDMSEELLREARSRQLANADFRFADLREPLDLGTEVDGLCVRGAFEFQPSVEKINTEFVPPVCPASHGSNTCH